MMLGIEKYYYLKEEGQEPVRFLFERFIVHDVEHVVKVLVGVHHVVWVGRTPLLLPNALHNENIIN